MRFVIKLLLLSSIAYGSYWAWDNLPFIRSTTYDLFHIGKFRTLEVRHSAEHIIKTYKKIIY